MQCLTLALENPPQAGEYRVFNQFEECYTIEELAEKVREAAACRRPDEWRSSITRTRAPRTSSTTTILTVRHLIDLGYQPTQDVVAEIRTCSRTCCRTAERILAQA